MSLKLTFTLIAAGLLCASGVLQGQGEPSSDSLVPAAMGIRTDRQGNSWNIEPNGTVGRIGSTMVNSGLELSVNGEKFTSYQPMMSRDSNEFVLRGRRIESVPGLQLQRRIRVLAADTTRTETNQEEGGGVRYVELFYNGSTDPLTFTVALTTNFSGNYKHFISDRGASEPVMLSSQESGILVLPGSSQSAKAFLFTLADPESSVKPTISAQNRYALTFRYELTLQPGETGGILHKVAQVRIPQNFDRKTLLKTFRPHSFGESVGIADREWSRFLTNTAGNSDAQSLTQRSSRVPDLEIDPGPQDILALGNTSRLLGKARASSLRLQSAYGEIGFDLSQINAIAGYGPEASVFFADGQVISGALEAEGFTFSQTGGGDVDLKPGTLDRLILAERGEVKNEPTRYFAETHRGDRLLVPGVGDAKLRGMSPWGRLSFSLEELVYLGPGESGVPGFRVELENGTRCLLYLANEPLALSNGLLEGAELHTASLRRIVTGKTGTAPMDVEPEPGKTVFRVGEEQILVGSLGNSTISVRSSGQEIETGVSEIKRIEKIRSPGTLLGGLPVEEVVLRLERWDGGIVEGLCSLQLLSVSVSGESWSVPLADIRRIDMALPSLNAENQKKIQLLVQKLGDPAWSQREKATRELGAFGYLARPVLNRELRTSEDPEVIRRIERVLSGLN